MEIDELKEWMDERFDRVEKRLDFINGRVNTQEKWLWYFRGAGAIILLALGYLGLK